MTRTGLAIPGGGSVDESLFGPKKTNKKFRKQQQSLEEGAVVISRDQLITIVTHARTEPFQTTNNNQRTNDALEKQQKAKARIEYIKQRQAQSSSLDENTDIGAENAAKDKSIRDAASIKMDAATDVVKLLSTIGSRAAAFTMREKQLQEKKHREEVEEEYERRMDLIMEVDRLKDTRRREEEERNKVIKRHEDRKVITEQIEERKRLQILAAEAREQENVAMRALMKKFEEEDVRNAELRHKAIEKSKDEVILANKAAIQKKIDRKLEAQQEVERLLEYQRVRDAELKRREDEEAEIARAKIARQAQLLAEQERVLSSNDKREELLARRFAEEKERQQRTKEREQRLRRLEESKMLVVYRDRAAEQKRRQQEAERAQELQYLERCRILNEQQALREQQESLAKKNHSHSHRQFLLEQIDAMEKQRLNERNARFAEGEASRAKERQEVARFSAIRDDMVRDMERQGVDPRYLAEMRAVNIEKAMKRV